MLRQVMLIATCVTTALHPFCAIAQANAPKSGVVRIVPTDTNKLPGTGFIVKIDKRAVYVLTASHVVEGSAAPKVEFFRQRDTYVPARIVEGAEFGDSRGLALLIADAPPSANLLALPIDVSTKLEGGEPITVIGHPANGGSWAITRGDVTSRRGRVLYFSAPIDQGNSGGPLLREGHVVGIVTNKGPIFGEAVEALTIQAFLAGSGIDIIPTAFNKLSSPQPQAAASTTSRGLTVSPPPRLPVAELKPGEVFQDCGPCPEMVVIRTGKYRMGTAGSEKSVMFNEAPHEVVIARQLAIARSEITRKQYALFVNATNYRGTGVQCRWNQLGFEQTDDHPVVCVNWDDVKAYISWLKKGTGKNYRLPSEAEWEYAARAGTTSATHWADTFDFEGCEYANVADATAKRFNVGATDYARCDDGYSFTAPVKSKKANPFGLHDMIGNVWEWTEDCWNEDYAGALQNGEAWVQGDCARRGLRGGSWNNGPTGARAAVRFKAHANERANGIGFRVVRGD